MDICVRQENVSDMIKRLKEAERKQRKGGEPEEERSITQSRFCDPELI